MRPVSSFNCKDSRRSRVRKQLKSGRTGVLAWISLVMQALVRPLVLLNATLFAFGTQFSVAGPLLSVFFSLQAAMWPVAMLAGGRFAPGSPGKDPALATPPPTETSHTSRAEHPSRRSLSPSRAMSSETSPSCCAARRDSAESRQGCRRARRVEAALRCPESRASKGFVAARSFIAIVYLPPATQSRHR